VTRKDTQPITIAVPALVSVELFEAVQEQMAENRRRCRESRRGPSFLLQGLLVCPACGYAWFGQRRYEHKSAQARAGTYRCGGRVGAADATDRPRCRAKPIRAPELEEAVWRDVCQLLRQPERLEAEYERRLQRPDDASATSQSLAARIAKLKRGIGRMIDAYRDGFLESTEFEPRMRESKERLSRLQAEQTELADEESQRADLRLVIGQIEDFVQQLDQGLEKADWQTRRQIIKALVKEVKVSDEQVCIVYRVNTDPFVKAPKGGFAQDCPRRPDTFSLSLPGERNR